MHKDDRPGGGALALCPTSAVALAGLADEVRGYVAASLAPVTRRDYATDWRLFTAWCDERGVGALPAAPATLILYLSDMAGQQSTALLSRRLTSIARRIATPATSRRRPTRWCGGRGVASAAPTAPPRWARRRPRPRRAGHGRHARLLDPDRAAGPGAARGPLRGGLPAVRGRRRERPRATGHRDAAAAGQAAGPKGLAPYRPQPGSKAPAAPDCGGRDRRRVPGAGPGAARVPGVRLRRHRAGLEPRRRSRRRGGRRAGALRRADPWEDIVDGRTGCGRSTTPTTSVPARSRCTWPASTT
jgi:hypothetical protein